VGVGAWRLVLAYPARFLDRHHHSFQIARHFGVRESYEAITTLFEKARARRVVCGLFGFSVAVAVDLDAQVSRRAIEISDKPTEQHMLAADVDAGAVVAQNGPETLLGEGERVPQFPGAVPNRRGDSKAGAA